MGVVSYQTIGIFLEGIATQLESEGAAGQTAARYMTAGALYVDGIDGAVEDRSAGRIAASMAASMAFNAGVSPATLGRAAIATVEVLAEGAIVAEGAPIIAGIALSLILGWAAGELAGKAYDLSLRLSDLLRNFLADPLVLDLDGDGVELTPLAQTTVLFDIDADGHEERTGWVKPDDGFLIRDANGNGIVDGVGEMFGATNVDGIDVLKTFDANDDGRITAADPVFADLRVWRDLNADGISTADEMITLADAGIASFNLGSSQVDTDVSGNIVARSGTYVRTDGSTRTMASVDFALDEIKPAIPADADLSALAVLPNLSGQAGLPDLRTAMLLDPTLQSMVENLVYGSHDFETFADFRDGGFLDVLYRWAGIDTSVPLGPDDDPYYIQALSAFVGRPFAELNGHQQSVVDDVWPEFVKELGVTFLVQAATLPSIKPFHEMQDALAALDPDDPAFQSDLGTILQNAMSSSAAAQPAYDYLKHFSSLSFDLSTGELAGDFDGFVQDFIKDEPSFFTFTGAGGGGGGGSGAITMGGGDDANRSPWTAWYEDEGSLLFSIAAAMGIGSDYVLTATGWRWLAGQATDEYGTAGNDVMSYTVTQYTQTAFGSSGAYLVTTDTHDQRLFGYEGDDELRGNDGVDSLVGGPGNDLLKGGADSDMYVYASGDGLDRIIDDSGADDTIYFSNELSSQSLSVTKMAGTNDLFLSFGNAAEGIILTNQWSSPTAAIEHLHFVGEAMVNAGDIASLYLASLATAGADSITGSWAGERLIGLDGNDSLSGAGGDDVLDGGTGDDALDGDDGFDTLAGGSGNDRLNGGNGDDVLVGGTGNDTLIGGIGNDTYRFARGDGQDLVADQNWGTDTIEFAAGISASDLTVVQGDNGNDLVLKINGTTDQVTLGASMISGYYRIEQVKFADGSTLNHAQLVQMSLANNGGNDTFYGSYDGETLDAGAGNDTINARDGDDFLIGGTGNDTLIGGAGNDTYHFDRGDGQDLVADQNWGNDTIDFAPGIAASDLTVVQANNGSDLILKINGTTDQVTLGATMLNGYYRIEQVRFADGSTLNHAQLMQMSLVNNGGNDTFYGTYDGETLDAGAGNDTINARDGDDVLIGGTGNDTLIGGAGNDTYRFARGDGQDLIADQNWGTDTIEFAAGISASDLTVVQGGNGDDLVLKINGTTDQVTLGATMLNGYYRIEQVRFADGSTLNHAQLVQMSLANNGGNDTFYGSYDGETLDAGAGNDSLFARDGNDTLIGGEGDDVLNGGSGTDIARVAGLRSSYTLQTVDGQVRLVDNDAVTDGNDGTDTLVGIETIQFKDQSMGIVSPIILDLGGDGVQTVSASQSRARFDMDGDGTADVTSWIGANDGFLFLDRDGNGTLSGVDEMSFTGDLPGAETDLKGLSAFDSNGDGQISAADARFGDFRVWRDRNGDGSVQSGEVLTLSQIGLSSISLSAATTSTTSRPGDVVAVNSGSWIRTDGRTMDLTDAQMTYFSGSGGAGTLPGKSGLGRALEVLRDHARFGSELSWDSLIETLGDAVRHAAAEAPFAAGGASQSEGIQRAPVASVEPLGDPGTAELDRRVALMVQDLAAFGADHAARIELHARNEHQSADFFAR